MAKKKAKKKTGSVTMPTAVPTVRQGRQAMPPGRHMMPDGRMMGGMPPGMGPAAMKAKKKAKKGKKGKPPWM